MCMVLALHKIRKQWLCIYYAFLYSVPNVWFNNNNNNNNSNKLLQVVASSDEYGFLLSFSVNIITMRYIPVTD